MATLIDLTDPDVIADLCRTDRVPGPDDAAYWEVEPGNYSALPHRPGVHRQSRTTVVAPKRWEL